MRLKPHCWYTNRRFSTDLQQLSSGDTKETTVIGKIQATGKTCQGRPNPSAKKIRRTNHYYTIAGSYLEIGSFLAGNLSELCSVRFNLQQTRQAVDPG